MENNLQLPEGWFSDRDIVTYRALIEQIPQGGTLVELGTWKGRSLCSVADLIIKKEIKVVAIDTFEGTTNEGDAHKEAREIDLKAEFENNIKRFGISSKVEAHKMLTLQASTELDVKADMIFVDADHSTEAVLADIQAWMPHLKEGGRITGHDWSWESVRNAIFLSGIQINSLDNLWFQGDLYPNKTFSVCFIGRNEAKVLPKALASLEEFKARGGEVCFVDTGSTDDTAKIAREWGCKTKEVGDKFKELISKDEADKINKSFIVEGEEVCVNPADTLFNFAAARNESANMSSNSHIMWMDCDEAITAFNIDEINRQVRLGVDQFEYVFTFNHKPDGSADVEFIQSKFYNKDVFEWKGIIHEVICLKDNSYHSKAGPLIRLAPEVYHLEHWQNYETNRSGYLKGLALDCYRNPTNDRNSHYFGRELLWNNRPKSAIREFKRHLTISWWPAEQGQSMIFIGDAYAYLGDIELAKEWYWKAWEKEPKRREALMRLADIYFKENNHQKAACYAAMCLEIAWDGFYANNKAHYEHLPHEILYVSKWWLKDVEGSKYHFDKALEFCPYNSKYLHDIVFYYDLPKMSIVIPHLSLGIEEREAGLQRCLDSIKNLNYPQDKIEVIVENDEPRLGVPTRVKMATERATGDYVVYMSNDAEFTPDSLIIAYLHSKKEDKELVAFNTGNKEADRLDCYGGSICEHFMIKKDGYLFDKIGEIFSTEFNHVGVDNNLYLQAKRLNNFTWCEQAVIIHHHWKDGGIFDKVSEMGWNNDNVQNDRLLLKTKTFSRTLLDFTYKILFNNNFSFTKVGDGELLCISGAQGANCDGQQYSSKLGEMLKDTYRWMARKPNIFLGQQTNKEWEQRSIEADVFANLSPNLIDGDIFLHREGEMVPERYSFYKTIKESKRHKIFIGPKKLSRIKELLNIDDLIEVKDSNAFEDFSFTLSATYGIIKDNDIVFFSTGLMSKVLIHQLLLKNPNITCIDIGSAFDSLFIGQTRTCQIAQNEMETYYKDLLL